MEIVLVSSCCGDSRVDEDYCICPDCKEHCEIQCLGCTEFECLVPELLGKGGCKYLDE